MSVRKFSVRLGMAAVAVSGLALTALAPANADTKPSGPDYVLGTTVIGVGSDTTQWVDDTLSADYNTFNAGQAVKTPYWANFDACVGKDVGGTGVNPDHSGFPCGADNTGTKPGVKRDDGIIDPAAAGTVNVPNSSGSGRSLLYTPSDPLFNDIAYARSSGPLATTDQQNGLIALPFAVDKIVVATHPGGPAPASLTGQQVLGIYNGTYTNWNQVGGSNAKIHAYMPKNGSSTLNAFLGFLAALNKGATVSTVASQIWQGQAGAPPITDANWNTGVASGATPTAANVEEHDPSVIAADPKAIEPFSYGRAQLANGGSPLVRIEGGWSADRELYHVVRNQNISGAGSTPFVYGSDGGVLENLFSNTGWVCTSSTSLADINSSGFWPMPSGSCGVKNTNTLDTIDPTASTGVGEGAATTTTALFFGGAVHVSVSTAAATPTGSVEVVVGKTPAPGLPAPAASFHKVVSLAADGTASVTLPASVSGANAFHVAYLPTGFGANGSTGHSALLPSYKDFSANVPVVKVGTTMKASASPLTLANKTKNTHVTTTVKAVSGKAKPTGTINIYRGRTKVGTGTLKATSTSRTSKVVITVKGTSLVKGTNKLTVKYVPKGGFKAPKTWPTVTIHRTK